jgi:hypothetical protein
MALFSASQAIDLAPPLNWFRSYYVGRRELDEMPPKLTRACIYIHPTGSQYRSSWVSSTRVRAEDEHERTDASTAYPWLLGINDTAIDSVMSAMIIHSRTSIRLVPARSDILP